jgi:hypothetical protein
LLLIYLHVQIVQLRQQRLYLFCQPDVLPL